MANILVVDDDQDVAELVALVLRQAGHTSHVAHNVTDAQSVLNEIAIEGAVIDVWLGVEDGLSLAGIVQDQPRHLPFLIMSGGGPGKTLEVVTAKADALGAHTVLFKPFDNDELISAVDEMLR